MNYSVRPYQSGDETNIVELLECVFNGWLKFDLEYLTLDHWIWKYLNNPCGKSPISLAVSDDKIIGCSHTLLSRAKIGDQTFVIGYGPDLAVHPDFRRMGVWRNIDDLMKEIRPKMNVNVSLSISGNPIVVKSLSKAYPRFPFNIFHFVRINDVALHFRMRTIKHVLLMKYGYHLLNLFNSIRNLFTISPTSSQLIDISEVSRFDKRIDIFWSEIKDNYHFIFERNQNYLNWRYSDPRAGKFLIKIAEENKKLIGYIVLRINKYQINYPIGCIVDLIALPNRLDAVEILVKDAVNYFNSKNINIIQCLLIKGHPYEKILKKHRFLNSRKRINIFYKQYKKIDELNKLKLSTPDRIYFVYGNYDSI